MKGLVVLDGRMMVVWSGDDDMCTTQENTIGNLHTDGTFVDTSEQCVLVTKCGAWGGKFMKDIKVDASQVATISPANAYLMLQVNERDLVGQNWCHARSQLWMQELWWGTTIPGADTVTSWLNIFPQRSNDALIKTLYTILLLLADTRLQLDNSPEFQNIILHFLNIENAGNGITAHHLINISLEFVQILVHDFWVDRWQ